MAKELLLPSGIAEGQEPIPKKGFWSQLFGRREETGVAGWTPEKITELTVVAGAAGAEELHFAAKGGDISETQTITGLAQTAGGTMLGEKAVARQVKHGRQTEVTLKVTFKRERRG